MIAAAPGEGASDSCHPPSSLSRAREEKENLYLYHRRDDDVPVEWPRPAVDVRDEPIRKHDETMANDEVLGPRKTMFILVIVVGCFAVLWPRILSPIIVGHQKQHLQPNQFDRDAGCCEVMFESELAVLELINEVCSSAVHIDGKISPYAAAECRKAVNETCGVDIAAFLKRTENVGKTSRLLVQTMQRSNGSCLKEHFGVPVMSLGPHLAYNSWAFEDKLKQERSPIRGGGPHPALRERGRAIPAGTPAPAPPPRGSTIQMPAHVRVRSPLQGYFELDIKPPPIPGMRPPLGSPGGPAPTPKSSMGFVMPIYTICIILFFVYTISKIFFKRAIVPYEPLEPSPQFRKRVFRDDSRTTPDNIVVTAISGLVAEVRQQMEASYAQNQQTQERQDNHNNTRPYTNGTVLHNSGPVHIIASEYQAKDKSPEPKENSPEPKSPEAKLKSALEEVEEVVKDVIEREGIIDEKKEAQSLEIEKEAKEVEVDIKETIEEDIEETKPEKEEIISKKVESNHKVSNDLVDLPEPTAVQKNSDFLSKVTEDFMKEAKDRAEDEKTKLLEEALNDDEQEFEDEEQEEEEEEVDEEELEKSSVKVVGMEVRAESADGGAFPTPSPAQAQSHAHHPPPHPPPPSAPPRTPHEAEDVKSIFLETEIPQKSRVLVDFAEDAREHTPPTKHSPMVVSGKMTLSLIQDAPRDTPERDAESTVDDFTTASAVTHDAAEKEGSESEDEVEEVDEEVEEVEEVVEEEEEVVEEEEEVVEEEVVEEEEEVEEEPEQPVKKTDK